MTLRRRGTFGLTLLVALVSSSFIDHVAHKVDERVAMAIVADPDTPPAEKEAWKEYLGVLADNTYGSVNPLSPLDYLRRTSRHRPIFAKPENQDPTQRSTPLALIAHPYSRRGR